MIGGRALAAAALCAASAAAGQPEPAPEAAAPAGRSLLAELFPDGLPHPFEAALDSLRDMAAPDGVTTALVPVGRSLQRLTAAPDFFASPRVLVAVTADDAAGPDTPRLAGRLFLGFQPAADVVEAISYDEAAGRFEFEEIVGYGAARSATSAERAVCLACHQGAAPIFPRPLWDETNANAAVADRLVALGDSFHGAPVRQSVDALAAFDAATEAASAALVANRLWSDGCPDAACRAGLLVAALGYGLGGASPAWEPRASPARAAFETQVATLWPEGLAAIGPDIPNRDPLTAPAEAPTETAGASNPETLRAAEVVWTPADGFAAAVRRIAAGFTPGDLDRLALRLGAPASHHAIAELPCATRLTGDETRFVCENETARIEGFLGANGRGRLDRIAVDGASGARLPIGAPGPAPRLSDGRAIRLAFRDDAVRITVSDDLAPLAAALAERLDDPALGPGPFRRRAALALIDRAIGGADG